MLDDVTELRTFVAIVRARSLSAAAREIGLALSVVSKRLATLERRTKTRLMETGPSYRSRHGGRTATPSAGR